MIDPLRLHGDSTPGPGAFVLYWMQATMRVHDNAALVHAIDVADRLGLPVLVYQGLRSDHRWASARFHTFILQGVVDVQRELRARGIAFCFWLDRPGASPSPLVDLARRAALVVTDYAPAFIHPRQTAGLRKRVATPVVAVDSAAVVPMRFHDRAQATARGIRTVLLGALAANLRPPPDRTPRNRSLVEVESLEVTPESIAALVAACHVDHSVPPSSFTGGTTAGRARLAAFLADGLPRYEAERSDPNSGAESRLSPWLHFGHLSPWEVVGPTRHHEKFLDEVLIWRELGLNFCHMDPSYHRYEATPPWAAAQLVEHEGDPRPALFDRATLEEARTGEPLWDAAMRLYRRDGWMHNALRMLWGKAVIQWTRTAPEAFGHLVELNNRWALDGRDPSSWMNIHWVFGKFDRPFYRRPIYGTVRYMSLRTARDKFDVDAVVRAAARGGRG